MTENYREGRMWFGHLDHTSFFTQPFKAGNSKFHGATIDSVVSCVVVSFIRHKIVTTAHTENIR